MIQAQTLFGKKIVPHHMLNYAEQIYDILVGEIESGRWKVNERLPGVMYLAKELGFGTKTVQTAYDRLKEEGYVRILGYRGTFLHAIHPRAKKIVGKIGILVSEEQNGDPLVLWYEHVILQSALRKNWVTEVKVLPKSMDLLQVNLRGKFFSDDTTGIISLTAFRMPIRYGDMTGTIPLVFLCPPFEKCAPKVCADVREAYYDLTSRVIRLGHKRVLFSEDSIEPDPRQTEMHREGYFDAMRENGLPVDSSLMEASRAVKNSDLPTVLEHLNEIARLGKSRRPTVVVAGSLGRAMALARMAPLHSLKIPKDISLVTIGSAHIEGQKGPQITGMLPDFDHMVEMCLKLLEQQSTSGKSDFTMIHVRMHFLPGDTLRPIAGNADGSAGKSSSRMRDQDIQTLSKAVHF